MTIRDILEKHYDLKVNELTPLEGYESSNFRVDTPDGTYICKVYPKNPKITGELLAEDRILTILNNSGGEAFPKPIKTLSGNPFLEKENTIYRLLSFLPGTFLGSVPHTSELLNSLGRFLGKMDTTLRDTSEIALEAKELLWDLRKTEQCKTLLHHIHKPDNRSLVSYFLLQYEENVKPVSHLLRKGIIHNDANDWNVLTNGKTVTGIIDFGDMCHTWLASEVAIGMTYVMMHKEDPLAYGLMVLEGYQQEFTLTEVECDCLYDLIAARLCISVCSSARAAKLQPNSKYVTISEEGAWKLLWQWLRINPIDAANRFRKTCGFGRVKTIPTSRLLENRDQHFGKNISLTYRIPIHMHKAAFQYMYDTAGNTFLDAYNNIMLVGHCHPDVVHAGRKAMARLNTNTRYLYDALEAYSSALLNRFPSVLNKVFFVNSGSEASDLAVRLARYHSKKKKVAVLEHGYHGHTQGGMEISSYKFNHKGSGGRPQNILELPLPKTYGTSLQDDGTAGQIFADKALEQLRKNKGKIAAFIAEPIVGCGGQVPLALGYLNTIYPEIRAQGGVCISDEVQVGFGRLGDVFWGYELFDVVPDIVILGKPMGNGHPIGAVVTTTEIAESFQRGPEFFSSFGGNPVSCAIGLAVLEVLEKEDRQEHARKTGAYLKNALGKLAQKHSAIGDVRGHGLFLGVELVSPDGVPLTELASHLKNALREASVLVSTDGPHENVIKIKPPLTFDRENADELVSKMDIILEGNMVFP